MSAKDDRVTELMRWEHRPAALECEAADEFSRVLGTRIAVRRQLRFGVLGLVLVGLGSLLYLGTGGEERPEHRSIARVAPGNGSDWIAELDGIYDEVYGATDDLEWGWSEGVSGLDIEDSLQWFDEPNVADYWPPIEDGLNDNLSALAQLIELTEIQETL